MNQDALAEWVVKKTETGLSLRRLARELGFADTSVRAWKDKEVSSLSPEAIFAIAAHDNSSVEDTCTWLGVPVPKAVASEDRIKSLERKVVELTEITTRLHSALSA